MPSETAGYGSSLRLSSFGLLEPSRPHSGPITARIRNSEGWPAALVAEIMAASPYVYDASIVCRRQSNKLSGVYSRKDNSTLDLLSFSRPWVIRHRKHLLLEADH